MARYAIPSGNALGVAMKDIKALGRQLGRDHALAQALWQSDVYEMRMLVQFVGDPDELTAAEMDRWVKSFDNWAYCDALSFNLFDRSPHAWDKVRQWSGRKEEFVRRTAFALLWSLALHDKTAPDSAFEEGLALIEAAAGDARNFVKKAASMALKAIGQRNAALRTRATAVAMRLAAADDITMRWIGKDALTALIKRR